MVSSRGVVSVGELKRKTIGDSLGTVLRSGSRVPMLEAVRMKAGSSAPSRARRVSVVVYKTTNYFYKPHVDLSAILQGEVYSTPVKRYIPCGYPLSINCLWVAEPNANLT